MKWGLSLKGLQIGLCVAAVSCALIPFKNPLVEQLNLRLLDAKFRLRPASAPSDAIVLVAIDKESLAGVSRWPWPRETMARLVETISQCRPRAIGLDVLFAGGGASDSEALAAALRESNRAVLSIFFYLDQHEARHQPQAAFESAVASLSGSRVNAVLQSGPPAEVTHVLQAYGVEANAAPLHDAARGVGFYNAMAALDGSIRQVPLLIQAQGGYYPSLALEVLRMLPGQGVLQLILDGPEAKEVLLGDYRISCDSQALYFINYADPRRRFPLLSAARILDGTFDRKRIEGKIVLVGGTAPGAFESRVSPFNPMTSSIEIQATVVENILTGFHLDQRIRGAGLTAACVVAFTLLLGLLLPLVRRTTGELAVFLGVAAAFLACDYALFVVLRRTISTLYPLFSIFAGYLAVTKYIGYRRETHQRLQRRTALELSAALGAILDPPALLPKVLDAFMGITAAERGLLTVAEGAERRPAVAAGRGLDEAQWESPAFAFAREMAGRSAASGSIIAIPSVPRALRKARVRGAAAPTRYLLCIPLKGKGAPLGMIYVDSGSVPPPFGFDVDVLASLARQVATSMENAFLYARVREHEEALASENVYLKIERQAAWGGSSLIGESKAMQAVYALIEKTAGSTISVLIEGETGTGKELIARSIHALSTRRAQLFVAQNCSALPESLLESELFGHVRGAFTGAAQDKKGLLELAHGGTVFLDEVADMSAGLQAKLLRVLQEGSLRPVGGVEERRVDLRIISATNKNLEEEVAAGRFREDLFYRLNAIVIHVPPLRQREGDLDLLVPHLIERFSRKLDKRVQGISREAMVCLRNYPFPGNIRELENEIERAVLLAPEGGTIESRSLSEKITGLPRGEFPAEVSAAPGVNLKEAIALVQRTWIVRALTDSGGNKSRAAEELGVSRRGLDEMIRRLDIRI
ncbi:MAG: sigma 54-interacting transcriptional regulator [Chlamydiae bacterium]|nr:sigma 54-interacting transcriptional regulator [Chlamydiota bacterium]